jgi:DNA primase
MQLSPAFLDELRRRTSLSALVGRAVKLRRAGREWTACCPFHSEKTPSFTVSDEKGFYHCLGCGAHGDVIDWLVDRQGLTFLDAVRELAGAAGLAMPERQAPVADDRVGHDVLQRAAAWFEEQLAGTGGAAARAYLQQRGIAPALVRAFGLGFAPASRSALRSALAAAGDARLIEAGLLIEPEGGGAPYDRFRDRLMIPIRDRRGRVIAFGGRALGDATPKYLNSPETALFDKGATLFNLDRAAAPARRARRLIVVEGYLDVIALAGVGIDDAVAPLGTAITERQLDLAWRVVPEPVLMLDGDAAGGKAAFRAAERALPTLACDRTLRIARLPAGQDPDDVARAGGGAAIEAIAARAAPLADFLFTHELAATPLETPEARAALKRRLEAHAAAIGDRELSFQYQAEFRRRANERFRYVPRGDARPRPSHYRRRTPVDADAIILGAVLHGLHRMPDVARREAERLVLLVGLDASQDGAVQAAVDAAWRGDELPVIALPPMGFRFGFNREKPPADAAEQLAEMIGELVERASARRAA